MMMFFAVQFACRRMGVFCPKGFKFIECDIPVAVGIHGLETPLEDFKPIRIFDLAQELLFGEFAVMVFVLGLENLLGFLQFLLQGRLFRLSILGPGRRHADAQSQAQNRKYFPHNRSPLAHKRPASLALFRPVRY